MNYLQHTIIDALLEATPEDQNIYWNWVINEASARLGDSAVPFTQVWLIVTSFHNDGRLINFYEEKCYENLSAHPDLNDLNAEDKTEVESLMETRMEMLKDDVENRSLLEGRIRV